MYSNGSRAMIFCAASGKNEIGINSPESISISQYFARIKAKIDFSGIARVPIMKLIAAIKKKLPSTLTRNSAKFSREAGPCTGNTNATTIAVGSVSSPRRNADSPIALQIHSDLAFDHLIRHLLVNRVPVERPNHPADAHVGNNLRQAEPRNRLRRVKNRRPNEVVHRHVEKIRDDAGEIAQPKSEDVDEPNARKFRVRHQRIGEAVHTVTSGSASPA